jgi:hypothetical protein
MIEVDCTMVLGMKPFEGVLWPETRLREQQKVSYRYWAYSTVPEVVTCAPSDHC